MDTGALTTMADTEAWGIQEERNRIAKLIHDGVSQNLALLMLKMEIISRLADEDPSRMKVEISKAVKILETCVQELRNAVHSLRTPDVERLGLLRAARLLADDFSRQTRSTVCVDLPDQCQASPDLQTALFRAVQKRFDTISIEGSANTLWLSMIESSGHIVVTLRDDGFYPSGFVTVDSPDNRTREDHGLRDELAPYGGDLRIVHSPPYTTIEMDVPFSAAPA
jgi:signal transduction histidine kinase